MALKLFSRGKSDSQVATRRVKRTESVRSPSPADSSYEPAPRETFDNDPLLRAFQQGRYSTILREKAKWRQNAEGSAIIERAVLDLERTMALVPAGSVTVPRTLAAQPGAPEEESDVEPFLLDVHCVTHARFQKFVDAGGYDALEFWPEEIWPHLIELKDLTDQPGPRLWQNGRHNTVLAKHPVAGISWFEAQAFALWIGQRLPTETEWQMAASWHIKSSTDLMRRFPWGDAMDNRRCNIWSSRHGRTVPVDEYASGTAPNQVCQLVGNVWEWTDSEFTVVDEANRPIVGEMPMHVIRGGAFDTYFETQATNYFRSGQIALARAYNTGFRCAMDLSDASWMNGS